MSIIFVHELGHFFAAFCFRWNIDKIYIYPLGGITKFNETLNKKLIQEFFIVIMGPFFQCAYFLILNYLGVKNIFIFNFFLLLFNLLPIYPLDGGKILNIFLSFFLSCRVSFKVTVFVSILFYILGLILFIFYFKSFFFVFVFFSLFFKIIEEVKNYRYYYNKFLLERYLQKYYFKDLVCVKNVFGFYRNKRHYLYKDGVMISEKNILKDYFE